MPSFETITRITPWALLCTLAGPPILLPAEIALAQTADFRSHDQAPPSWGQFAKLVKYRFEEWMAADDAVAARFRAFVTEHAGKEDGPPPSLVVRAWLEPDGTVARVAFPPLKNAQADADLRTILTRGNVGEAPPPEMLQPLNLRFGLDLERGPADKAGRGRP